jgi:putative methyltransferase (TIGR04325 family)
VFVVQKRLNTVAVKIRKTARRVLPGSVRRFLHKILRDEAPITVRYEMMQRWPEADDAASWRGAKMTPDVIREIAAFKLKLAKHSPQRVFAEPIVQDNLRLLSQIPLKEANFLDFGCGNGIYHHVLASYPSTHSWKYSGGDTNPEMIRFCKSMLPALRFQELHENGSLPFADQEFDVVLASGVIQYVQEYAKVLQELHRISKQYLVVTRLPLRDEDSVILVQYFKHRKDAVEQEVPLHVLNRAKFEDRLKQIGFRVLDARRGSEFLLMPQTSETVGYYGYLLQKGVPG